MCFTPLLAALALTLPAIAAAQEENAAHRADRLRTEQLNRHAAQAVARRDRSNAQIRQGGNDAQARYQRQLADWRRRVADCRAGHYEACE